MPWTSAEMNLAANRLFRRCVQCPQVTPKCPTCAAGQECNLSSQSCDTCPATSCIQMTSTGTSQLPSLANTSKPVNSGAVAGGVIAGVAVIALMVFLVWKFCIKNRRQEYEDDNWPIESTSTPSTTKIEQDAFSARRDARASTHTVGSIASTVFTRASNVIQIAYIPGVTNRSPPSSPGLLIPPVPPIPSAQSPDSSANTTPNYHQDQHFFMPSDLRDSTYSGMTTDDRQSMARSSVATTIYRNNAVINPVPAQTIVRGKAAVVSVKSSHANSPLDSPTGEAPPVPLISYDRSHPRSLGGSDDNQPPSPAFSIGSTFMKSTADTAKAVTAKPVRVKKSIGNLSITPSTSRRAESSNKASPLSSISTSISSPSSTENAKVRGASVQTPSLLDSDSSPFGDQQQAASPGLQSSHPPRTTSSAQRKQGASDTQKGGNLSAVIEEATRRASRQPTHGGLGSTRRDTSPFSDAHELGTMH